MRTIGTVYRESWIVYLLCLGRSLRATDISYSLGYDLQKPFPFVQFRNWLKLSTWPSYRPRGKLCSSLRNSGNQPASRGS